MHEIRPFIAGDWRDGATQSVIRDKYTDQPVTSVQEPDARLTEAALRELADAQARSTWDAYSRFTVLARASELLAGRRDDFIGQLCRRQEAWCRGQGSLPGSTDRRSIPASRGDPAGRPWR